MARVTIMMNNGKIKSVEKHHARALVHCKKAIYVNGYSNKMIVADAYTTKKIENKTPEPIEAPELDSDLVAIRAEYQKKMGKKAFHGWNIEQIKEKMIES